VQQPRRADPGGGPGAHWPGASALDLPTELAELAGRTVGVCTRLAVLATDTWRLEHEADPRARGSDAVTGPADGDPANRARPATIRRFIGRRRLLLTSVAAVIVGLASISVAAVGGSAPSRQAAPVLVPAALPVVDAPAPPDDAALPSAATVATAGTPGTIAPAALSATTVAEAWDAAPVLPEPEVAPVDIGVLPTTTVPIPTTAPPTAPPPAPVDEADATPPAAHQDRKSKSRVTAGVPITDVGWDVPLPPPHRTPPHVERDAVVRALEAKGWANGRLADWMLVEVDGCEMVPAAADAWRALVATARAEGVSISSSHCYRSFGAQEDVRSSACAVESCDYAATPGRSLHGWGLAVDVVVGRNALTFDGPEYRWLADRAAEFGFYHPDWAQPDGDTPEPWHWEYQAPVG
jgi:hypothetical protein